MIHFGGILEADGTIEEGWRGGGGIFGNLFTDSKILRVLAFAQVTSSLILRG